MKMTPAESKQGSRTCCEHRGEVGDLRASGVEGAGSDAQALRGSLRGYLQRLARNGIGDAHRDVIHARPREHRPQVMLPARVACLHALITLLCMPTSAGGPAAQPGTRCLALLLDSPLLHALSVGPHSLVLRHRDCQAAQCRQLSRLLDGSKKVGSFQRLCGCSRQMGGSPVNHST